MIRIKKKNQSGLTLVEVLVASAIMAFCLSGLLLTYVNMLTLTDVTRGFTLANNAGQHLMEMVKTNTFDNITNTSLPTGTVNDILNTSEFNSSSAWARIEVTTPSTNLKKIMVMVFFKIRNRPMWPDTDHDKIPDLNEYSSVEIVNYVGNYTSGNFTP
jgi:prepilin-type N-terminal cleavage/methylation domain-containing protein